MSGSDSNDGGRFGRQPHRPEELKAEYGTVESGRLDVTCPGCGRDFYPTSKCCVDRYAGSPFCPDCGTDFRHDATEDLQISVRLKQMINSIKKSHRPCSSLAEQDFDSAERELKGLIHGLESALEQLPTDEDN